MLVVLSVLKPDRNTYLAGAVFHNNGISKENLHFDDQSKQMVFFFPRVPIAFLSLSQMFTCASLSR